jgi:hypothetical protein
MVPRAPLAPFAPWNSRFQWQHETRFRFKGLIRDVGLCRDSFEIDCN